MLLWGGGERGVHNSLLAQNKHSTYQNVTCEIAKPQKKKLGLNQEDRALISIMHPRAAIQGLAIYMPTTFFYSYLSSNAQLSPSRSPPPTKNKKSSRLLSAAYRPLINPYSGENSVFPRGGKP